MSLSTEWILRPDGRPLFVFAHQDDEIVLAGIIRRVAKNGGGSFAWWTNGDGLAPGANMDPVEYGALRMRESDAALDALGVSREKKTDLACSEIENYRRLVEIPRGGSGRDAALEHFRREADRIERVVRDADPDRVFVLAWQGGHFEHDLVHVMTVRAVRKLRVETGRTIPIVQCPAYEFAIACALRFKPWFRGDRRAITLSADEMDAKRRAISAHVSQESLFRTFRRAIGAMTFVSRPFGGARSVDGFMAKEEFGVVDPVLDYGRSTHLSSAFDYMFDDYLGERIRFDAMVRPVVEAVLAS